MDKSVVACLLVKSAALGNERAREIFYGMKKDGKRQFAGVFYAHEE